MRIFKFGGASVKDADGVRNLVRVLKEVGFEDTFVVISAMGKTTNAMEAVVAAYFEDKRRISIVLQEVLDFHQHILLELFEKRNHPIFEKVQLLFDEVKGFLAWNKSPKYAFVYDQVVGYGELISTTIVSAYLDEVGLVNQWHDVRELIKTDNSYRDAHVNWERTQNEVQAKVDLSKLNITQG
ncbi:MAG: aspartate kinase, partial [Bacteroidota bacterium]